MSSRLIVQQVVPWYYRLPIDFLFCFLFLYQSNPYKVASSPANIAKLAKHTAVIIYITIGYIIQKCSIFLCQRVTLEQE